MAYKNVYTKIKIAVVVYSLRNRLKTSLDCFCLFVPSCTEWRASKSPELTVMLTWRQWKGSLSHEPPCHHAGPRRAKEAELSAVPRGSSVRPSISCSAAPDLNVVNRAMSSVIIGPRGLYWAVAVVLFDNNGHVTWSVTTQWPNVISNQPSYTRSALIVRSKPISSCTKSGHYLTT